MAGVGFRDPPLTNVSLDDEGRWTAPLRDSPTRK
jgi:hypothetical protein